MNWVCVILLFFVLGLPGLALPPDFEQEVFVDGLDAPSTMTFSPDGRLFVGERIEGKIRIVTASGQLLPTPFLTLDVPSERHRSAGVRGFAFDPDFSNSPYLYVFYLTEFPDGKRHNRVSRFTVSTSNPDLADPSSELVLLELPFNNSINGSSGSHNGGAVVFGGDGKLYITTGDGWNNWMENGITYSAGDDVQSLSTFTGKVFRINKDGTIPGDNPFLAQTTGSHRAIYALGLRNPYAATTHPVTGEVFVFDVGTANGNNKDHVFRVSPGDNYGHDGDDGIGTSKGTWAKLGTEIASGGVWYFADQFPETYHGRLFATAWKQGLKTITSIDDATVTDFGSGDVPNQGPLYPCVGPDGSLYYLNSTYVTNNGSVHRIRYTAANTAARPMITPSGGTFIDSVEVSFSTTTPDATIRYTLDGTTPTASSTIYTVPFSITQSDVIQARAFATGLDASNVASAAFNIVPSSAPAFTSSEVTSANVSSLYNYDVDASGVPAPTFSLDAAPVGMTINPTSGLISWTPSSPGNESVTIRASNGIGSDALQTFMVDVTNFRLADNPEEAELVNGLHFAYFENEETSAKKSGDVAMPDLTPRDQDDHFAFRFSGFLEIPESGNYLFNILSESTTLLTIGNAEIGAGGIGLEAGKHAFSLSHENENEAASLSLRWSGPSITEQEIPAANYFRYQAAYGVFARKPSPAYLNFPPDENSPPPALLSQTGAFKNLSTLTTEEGLVFYDMNSPLWSDAAGKLRWISVPTGTSITFETNSSWTFPPGTVLVKHFELGEERKRLETRFEIIKENGVPYFLTYRWREDHTESDLVPSEGITDTISFDNGQSQVWNFPSRANCVQCHNSSVGYILGPKTQQLNGTLLYPDSGVNDNQLRNWSHLGILGETPSVAELPAAVPLDDQVAPLELRLRSYFDTNCASCHNPSGSPEGTNFFLDFKIPLEQSGLLDGVTTDDLGLGLLARTIAPQDPQHSTLLHRMLSNDPAVQMPPIARNLIDPQARDLLIQWILSLSPANTSADVPGAIRHWTFDDTIETGSWRNATSPTYAAGQIGQALSFNGVDDAIDLGPLDVPGNQLTISLWFRADDFGISDARFLSKADGQDDQDHYWMLSTLNGSKLRLRLRAGGTTTTLISPEDTLVTNIWTHVAAVYDGNTMKLYKDAIEVASVGKTGVLDASGTVDAAIGNQPTTASGGPRPFDGLMDDLRIYDRALSPAELMIVRNAGQQTNTAPTVNLPAIESFLTRAQVANLNGTASDTEDGNLTASLTWFSNKDGEFDPAAGLSDGPHLIVLTGRDSDGSAVSQSQSVTVVPGFQGWLTDSGSGLLQDYALPQKPIAGIVEIPEGQRYLEVQFSPRPDAIDVTYTVQFSSDMMAWTDGATFTPTGTPSEITERDTLSIELPGNTKRFVRIKMNME